MMLHREKFFVSGHEEVSVTGIGKRGHAAKIQGSRGAAARASLTRLKSHLFQTNKRRRQLS
jgi:hypothetical protein